MQTHIKGKENREYTKHENKGNRRRNKGIASEIFLEISPFTAREYVVEQVDLRA